MKQILKHAVGIDVAQKELVVCLGCIYDDFHIDILSSKTFINSLKGFSALMLWVQKHKLELQDIYFVMEATGVYHQPLAYHLDQHNLKVNIVLPNKISNYMRTLDIKTITDHTAAQAITRFGLERKLDNWNRPKEIYLRLKQLTRERDQLIIERTHSKNQLHAEKSEAFPNPSAIRRVNERIKLLNKQEKQITNEIESLIHADKQVKNSVDLICSIPGIGIVTAAIVLAETNGFELITNRRQLASYAGFDIKEKQSGTSIKGKSRISKKGNKFLRKAMYMPSLSAIQCDSRARTTFSRLVSRHGIKMKAGIAVQRKLLEMTFTIFKTRRPYDKNFLQKTNLENPYEKTNPINRKAPA